MKYLIVLLILSSFFVFGCTIGESSASKIFIDKTDLCVMKYGEGYTYNFEYRIGEFCINDENAIQVIIKNQSIYEVVK